MADSSLSAAKQAAAVVAEEELELHKAETNKQSKAAKLEAAEVSEKTASSYSKGSRELQKAFRIAAEVLRQADALLICTGAGMGVDSGLDTFRGRHAGVWPPLKALGMDYTEICTPSHFDSDPRLAWAFWCYLYQTYVESAPHAGYKILASWGSKLKHGLFSVTSNIDGHWARITGVGPEKLFEVHGVVTHVQSLKGDDDEVWRIRNEEVALLELPSWDLAPGEQVEVQLHPDMEWTSAIVAENGCNITLLDGQPVAVHGVRRPGQVDLCRVTKSSPLPLCSGGGPARPNVKMFHDQYIAINRMAEQMDAFESWRESLPKETRLVVVEVGAGKTVPTIRRTAHEIVERFPNATLIRINLDDSDVPASLSEKSVSIGGIGALQALTRLDDLIQGLAIQNSSSSQDRLDLNLSALQLRDNCVEDVFADLFALVCFMLAVIWLNKFARFQSVRSAHQHQPLMHG